MKGFVKRKFPGIFFYILALNYLINAEYINIIIEALRFNDRYGWNTLSHKSKNQIPLVIK